MKKLWQLGLPRGKQKILHKVVFFSGFALIFLTVFSPYCPSPLLPSRFRVRPSSPPSSSSTLSPISTPQPHPQASPPPQKSPANEVQGAVGSAGGEGGGECDLSKGEWVWNPEAPYYTNVTCGEIQEHQNCIKHGRPDLEFLKWRWQPDGCELPVFDPAEFLELVRGRSVAFLGDSLARNQMQSLMCLLSRVEHPRDISHTQDHNFRRMHYAAHNFTLSIFWSPFLVRSEEAHMEGIDWTGLWSLYLDEADPSWASAPEIAASDFIVLSGGNWFARPSLFHERRRPVGSNYFLRSNITDLTLFFGHRRAFRTAFDALASRLQGGAVVFLRTVSPSHFENGEWNKGGDCLRTRPFRRNETAMAAMDARLYDDQVAEYRRAKEEAEKKGVRFELLDATGAMLLRPDGHPSRYGHPPEPKAAGHKDCVHWCLPGPVDMWNDLLLHMMKKHQR